ncbi:cytidine deaminase [Cryptococcus decagattii]|uniref:Cytidine deaminase n=1 Tax=Cryptococcus decagattii TaxID=1859122 RepID=A0ABZ2AMR7_9TREE
MSTQPLHLSSEVLDNLFSTAVIYRDRAYAPYSNYRVGAALLGADGQFYGGCNVENASYGAGICAERTAVVKAVSESQRNFLAVAVVSDIPSPSCSPCGICHCHFPSKEKILDLQANLRFIHTAPISLPICHEIRYVVKLIISQPIILPTVGPVELKPSICTE